MSSLNVKAAGGLLALLIAMGALLFVPAWTFDYWQAWVFLLVFGLSSLTATIYLMTYNAGLLERRLRGGPTAEKMLSQKIIMWIASVGFAAILVVPALDHRRDRGQYPDRAWMDNHHLCFQGKPIFVRDGRNHGRPARHINRALLNRAASDVQWVDSIFPRQTVGARIVAGTAREHLDDAGLHFEAV